MPYSITVGPDLTMTVDPATFSAVEVTVTNDDVADAPPVILTVLKDGVPIPQTANIPPLAIGASQVIPIARYYHAQDADAAASPVNWTARVYGRHRTGAVGTLPGTTDVIVDVLSSGVGGTAAWTVTET